MVDGPSNRTTDSHESSEKTRENRGIALLRLRPVASSEAVPETNDRAGARRRVPDRPGYGLPRPEQDAQCDNREREQ
jgi:hypothetical protein